MAEAAAPSSMPPCRNTDRGRFAHVFVFVFGVLSIVVLLLADRLRSRVVAEDTLLEANAAEIKTRITLAHLWVEERVSGDEVPVEEIDTALGEAVVRVGEMLGKGVSDGVSNEARLSDPNLRQIASELLDLLGEFRSFAALRRKSYDQGLPVGIGSFADKAFDREFRIVFDLAERLRQGLSEQRIRDERRSRVLFLGILGAWTIIVLGATAALRNRELQRRAAQHALLASQEQLFQSQKMDAVGRLAGGLAHDINNYLAAIRGHCELVRMTHPSGDKLAKRMDGAIQVVDKASSLLTRLLSISHRQPLALAVIDLNDLVADLERVFVPTLGAEITFEKRLTPDLWAVEADPSQLEQVMANLVVNAKDALGKGGTVTVSTFNRPALEASTQTEDEVWLEIEDTGEGIPPELLSRIFEPFLTTKPGKGHSGLGLAVVYGIVRQSGGKIEVQSQVGRGTLFRIRLPRSHAAKVSRDGRRRGTSPPGTEHLLLVDDNEEFRESTADWLRALGYRVTTAASGAEALERLAQEKVDVVVTDVHLGDADGRELSARFGEIVPGIPVLLVSGYDHQDSPDAPVSTVEILPKQKIDELSWRLREVLDSP